MSGKAGSWRAPSFAPRFTTKRSCLLGGTNASMICVNDTLAGHPTVADDEELLLAALALEPSPSKRPCVVHRSWSQPGGGTAAPAAEVSRGDKRVSSGRSSIAARSARAFMRHTSRRAVVRYTFFVIKAPPK